MSNYINVLRRLERERRMPEAVPTPPLPEAIVARIADHAAPSFADVPPAPPQVVPVAPTTPPVAPPARTVIPLPTAAPAPVPVTAPSTAVPVVPVVARAPETRPAHDTRRERAFATESHPGIATLLENIRLISNGRESRIVVFSGASTAEAVTFLADALATHAERSGMRTFVGTLGRTSQGPALLPPNGSTAGALSVDLDAGSSPQAVTGWVESIAPGSDLAILTGPPLATSIDAALLACACDGLVIVAESEVTDRAALQVAAERARIAGCKTLGVVMYGAKNRVPGWLRRLIGDRSESQVSRED